MADLPADFLDGSRQLFGGAGNGVDVAGGLLGGVGGGNGAALASDVTLVMDCAVWRIARHCR